MARFSTRFWHLVPSPAFGAALLLVVVQVGIGILMKTAQTGGRYDFSTSGSIAISEFLKLLLSLALFRSEVRSRGEALLLYGDAATDHTTDHVESGDPPPADYDDHDDDKVSTIRDATGAGTSASASASGSASGPRALLRSLAVEITPRARLGFVNLAMFYALINNTIFISYEVADPGTISLVRSTVTGMTALLSVVFLGRTVSELQWVAVLFQLAGLFVTQYAFNAGAPQPPYVYVFLFVQVFLSAASSVFNECLIKDGKASLHAQNAALYSAGTCVNLLIHLLTKLLHGAEPWLFGGYASVGAVLVILSNVAIGLAITAAYKYADAIIKCLASGITTAMLVYLSSILFGAPLSSLAMVGTAIIFLSSWSYMRSTSAWTVRAARTGPEDKMMRPGSRLEPTIRDRLAPPVSSWRPKPVVVSAVFTLFTVWLAVASRLYANSMHRARSQDVGVGVGVDVDVNVDVDVDVKSDSNSDSNSGSDSDSDSDADEATVTVTLESPFRNTLAFIRYNSEHYERMELTDKYKPFFHTLHYSGPSLMPPGRSNLTHDSFEPDAPESGWRMYLQVAETMQMILDGDEWPGLARPFFGAVVAEEAVDTSVIDGLVYLHFDAWMHPLEFATEPKDMLWINDVWVNPEARQSYEGPAFECMSDASKYGWPPLTRPDQLFHEAALATARQLVRDRAPFVVDADEFCTGWSDFYYVPRRFFRDYIQLALAFYEHGTFHEVAIPTMLHIIDRSRRRLPGESVLSRLSNTWGFCCAYALEPDVHDVLFHRMGHPLHYHHENQAPVAAFFAKLDRDAALLGRNFSLRADRTAADRRCDRDRCWRKYANLTIMEEADARAHAWRQPGPV